MDVYVAAIHSILFLTKFFFLNGPNPASFCLFSLFSHDKYSTNTVNEKAQMACLGLELGAAGW